VNSSSLGSRPFFCIARGHVRRGYDSRLSSPKARRSTRPTNASMNTLNFLDANVWLALLWNRHLHSERARSWFEQTGDEQFLFCRFTQITVLRLLSTNKIIGRDTRSMPQAWKLWDRIWADDRVSFLPSPKTLRRSFASVHSCPADLPKFGPMLTFLRSLRPRT
jgi:hypothetical protein